jgi:putative FmdB family regulatory protein
LPLYEYKCKQCGSVFEKIQKFSDAPLCKCEKCGGDLERLVSPPAIQFKGSGWYITDYARKSSQEASKDSAGKDTKAAETSKKPSDVKSDARSKPAESSKPAETTTTKK